MKTVTLKLPRLHKAQLQIKREARRFNVVDAGRRFGKNVLLQDRIIEPALRGKPVAWAAPTYKGLAEDWRDLKAILAPVTVAKLEQEHRIELLTGGVLDMWSLDNADAFRGRYYARVALNEAAQVPGLQEKWEKIIRATLTDLEGDAWFGSTPKGRGYFWRLFNRGQDEESWPEWKSWKFPTLSNPFVRAEEVEAARRELPADVFAQEYLAEFVQRDGAVFRNIDACMDSNLQPDIGEHKSHRKLAGVDWGKQSDFTAISIGCQTCHVELARDRFNQIDYAFQRARLAELLTRWGVDWAVAESNAMGEPIIEQLQRDGLPIVAFNTSATSKPPLIEGLALALEQGEWQFQGDPLWTAELEAYERKVSPITGRSAYSAPEGGHDDTVIARALMLHAANVPMGAALVSFA